MDKKNIVNKNIFLTLLLVFILVASYFVTSLLVNRIVTESCYRTLGDEAAQMTTLLRNQISSDREQLEIIADVLAAHDEIDSQEAQSHIVSMRQGRRISSVAILLPDNRTISYGETSLEGMGTLEFAEEAEKVPYISGVCSKGEEIQDKLIYQAIPIEKGGKTTGILYGVIGLDTLKEYLPITAFDGKAQLFVIDGATGDFIVDTWHDAPSNVADEALAGRKLRHDEDVKDVNVDILEGNTGHFAYHSLDGKENYYAYYMPAGIERWSVMITVPETEAFGSAKRIRNALYLLATVDIIVLLIYFLWVFAKVRNDGLLKEERLRKSIFMLDIQQILIDSYRHPERISAALEKTAEMLTAERVFLVKLNGRRIDSCYTWPEVNCGLKKQDLGVLFPQIREKFLRGEAVIQYENSGSMSGQKDWDKLRQHQVHSFMAIPIFDSEQHIAGIMGGTNMKRRWEDCSILEGIARAFLMAQSNLVNYQLIQRMGLWDALTGLKNRNSYQNVIKDYAESYDRKKLGCIYIDVNGLHELNNHLGHGAGDKMLIFVGAVLQEIFGSEDSYRIGGDEFLVFCPNMSRGVVEERIQTLKERMKEYDYHLSVGLSWQESLSNVSLLVSEAEQEMYEAKRRYYQEKGDVGKLREMNRKLEQILLEKKDADMFLSIISAYFKGVYVVNLDTDELRVIYKPSYFAEQLKATNNRFVAALKLYSDSFVYEEDRILFKDFLDYDRIRDKLEEGGIPQLEYRRRDGKRIILRIYQALDYSEEKKETLWLFEELK